LSLRESSPSLPATRFAVDGYVRFVREKSLLEVIASSLTELFSPAIGERVSGMLAHTTSSAAKRSPIWTSVRRRPSAIPISHWPT